MVSLDPELSKLFLVLMSTRHSSWPQNGSTFPKFPKRKLETSFLQHESKIEDSLRFFPDYARGRDRERYEPERQRRTANGTDRNRVTKTEQQRQKAVVTYRLHPFSATVQKPWKAKSESGRSGEAE